MVFLNGGQALTALLSLLSVPAVLLLAAGIYYWYTGAQNQLPDRLRMGKMLTLFGSIFLTIVLITSQFLRQLYPLS